MKVILTIFVLNFTLNIIYLNISSASEILSSQMDIQKIVHWRNRAIDIRKYMSRFRPPSGLYVGLKETSRNNNKCFYQANLLNLMQYKLDKVNLKFQYEKSKENLIFTYLDKEKTSKLGIEVPCNINEFYLKVLECSSSGKDLTKFCKGSLKVSKNSESESMLKIVRSNFQENSLNIKLPIRLKVSEKIQISEIDIEVSGITLEIANKYFLDDIEGLLITNVKSSGLGKIIGFRKGDIIAEVDQEVLYYPQELKNHIQRSLKINKSTLILIHRNNDYAHFLIKYQNKASYQ